MRVSPDWHFLDASKPQVGLPPGYRGVTEMDLARMLGDFAAR
jgi:hypothetical protein